MSRAVLPVIIQKPQVTQKPDGERTDRQSYAQSHF